MQAIWPLGAGKLNFSFLSSLSQTLQGHGIFAKIHTFITFKLFRQPINDFLVYIITTQMRIAIS